MLYRKTIKIRFFSKHDIGSEQQVNYPKYLISAHQTSLRTTTPNKKIIIAIFDNLNLRKYFVEIDGQIYPRDRVLINYEEKGLNSTI